MSRDLICTYQFKTYVCKVSPLLDIEIHEYRLPNVLASDTIQNSTQFERKKYCQSTHLIEKSSLLDLCINNIWVTENQMFLFQSNLKAHLSPTANFTHHQISNNSSIHFHFDVGWNIIFYRWPVLTNDFMIIHWTYMNFFKWKIFKSFLITKWKFLNMKIDICHKWFFVPSLIPKYVR